MSKRGYRYRDSDCGQYNGQINHSQPLKKQAEKQQASQQFPHGGTSETAAMN